MRHPITVRVVQHRPALGDLEANLADHKARVAAAAEDGADLVVFPELSLTGYALGDLVDAVAIHEGHPRWSDVCALSESVDVVLGVVERGAQGVYNSAAYLHGGRATHVHRKVYLPTFGPFDEGRFFAAGRALETFDAPWGRGAILICRECWHPSVIHAAVARGADVLFAIANVPGRGPVDGAWQSHVGWRQILGAYAKIYGVWIPFSDRVGYEEGIVFGGGSGVFAPDGSMIAAADFLETAELTATLDPAWIRRARSVNPMAAMERHELLLDALADVVDEERPSARAAAPRDLAVEREEP